MHWAGVLVVQTEFCITMCSPAGRGPSLSGGFSIRRGYDGGVEQGPIRLEYATPRPQKSSPWWWLLRLALAVPFSLIGAAAFINGVVATFSHNPGDIVLALLGLALLAVAYGAIRLPTHRQRVSHD